MREHNQANQYLKHLFTNNILKYKHRNNCSQLAYSSLLMLFILFCFSSAWKLKLNWLVCYWCWCLFLGFWHFKQISTKKSSCQYFKDNRFKLLWMTYYKWIYSTIAFPGSSQVPDFIASKSLFLFTNIINFWGRECLTWLPLNRWVHNTVEDGREECVTLSFLIVSL